MLRDSEASQTFYPTLIMKTNLNPPCCWLSPLFLVACGLLWNSPAPAHDGDPGRRPTFFSRLFHGGHKHKARVTVEEPQVVERTTTVTYPDGHVEQFVSTSPAVENTVREEVPAIAAPIHSMRSVRERPVTEVAPRDSDTGLRLPEGYVATPAPRAITRPVSPEPKPTISSPVDSRPNIVPEPKTKRTRGVRSEDEVVASTGNHDARDPETPRPSPKQRPATIEKQTKSASETPRSNTTPARNLTSTAPANSLEESPPSTAIETVQKKFERPAPTPAADRSSENSAPSEKMLIGSKTEKPADLPPSQEKMAAPKDPAPTGKEYPIAVRAEKPGFLKSPYEPFNQLDATGLTSGSLARDPTTGKIFRVP